MCCDSACNAVCFETTENKSVYFPIWLNDVLKFRAILSAKEGIEVYTETCVHHSPVQFCPAAVMHFL